MPTATFVYIVKRGFLITNWTREDDQLFGTYTSSQEAFDSVRHVADVIFWDVRA